MTKLSNAKALKESAFTQPSTELVTVVANITPALATKLIEQTDPTVQRKSKTGQIIYLAQQILDNKWQFNGDAIRQDIKGNIIDGLHRLKACVMADKTIKTLFIKGLPTEAIKTIDQAGAKRTLADYISIQYAESKYHTTSSAVMQTVSEFNLGRNGSFDSRQNVGGGLGKKNKIDRVYIDDFLAKNPAFFEFIANSTAIRTQGDMILTPKAFCSFHWILKGINEQRAGDFMYKLSTGAGLALDHPIYELRKRIIKSKTDTKNGKRGNLTGADMASIVFTTWNLYITGKKAKKRFSFKKVENLLSAPLID